MNDFNRAQTAIGVHLYPDGRMDVKNSAKYLGLSVKTLAMWRCGGKGPDFIKRGKVFYFKEDLDIWLQGGRQSTQPIPGFEK